MCKFFVCREKGRVTKGPSLSLFISQRENQLWSQPIYTFDNDVAPIEDPITYKDPPGGNNLQPSMARENALVPSAPPSVGNYHALIASPLLHTTFSKRIVAAGRVLIMILSTSDRI